MHDCQIAVSNKEASGQQRYQRIKKYQGNHKVGVVR
jgi:hypothetical protein